MSEKSLILLLWINAILGGSGLYAQESRIQNKFGSPNQISSGVNIHFTTGHEEDLDMIAAAGLKSVRMDLIWQRTETAKGIYDWSEYDELTGNLRKRGLAAIYILDYSNSLYEDTVLFKDPITGEKHKGIASPRNPESVEAFSRWAAAAVNHFRDSNLIWEIWNEPNINFWRPAPDINQYLKLALKTCRAIKTTVPNSIIIGPATSQIPWPFLESFLSSGILEFIDGVSVHPYRDYSRSPETAMADYWKLSEMIGHYTPEGKEKIPVISSEWGYSSATNGVSVETQAAFIVRMQLTSLLSDIPVTIWYDWKNDGNEPSDFEHNCGTVTSDLKPKPAYTAIRVMNEQLKGFTLIRRIRLESERDYLLLFRNGSGIDKLCGWTMDQEHTVVPGEIKAADSLSVTDWNGKEFRINSKVGRLNLELTGLPKYITLPAGM